MKTVTIITTALALAGCATPAERAARYAAEDDLACRSYGALPGQPAYIACRAQKDNTRKITDEMSDDAALGIAAGIGRR